MQVFERGLGVNVSVCGASGLVWGHRDGEWPALGRYSAEQALSPGSRSHKPGVVNPTLIPRKDGVEGRTRALEPRDGWEPWF